MDSKLDIKEEPVWREDHFESVTVASLPETDPEEVLDVKFKEEVKAEVLLPKVEEEEEESPSSSIQNLKEAARSEERDISRVLVKDIHPSAIESEVTNSPENTYNSKNGALGKSFLRSEDLQKLMSTHSRVMWGCHFCGKSFENEQLLKKHVMDHKEEKGLSLLIQSGMDSPTTATNEKRLYCCDLCGISSFHHEDIINHLKIHAQVKQYKCTVCPKSFPTQSNLRRHLQIHDAKRQRQHPCSICNKMYTRVDTLKRHELWHTGERRYSCTVCGRLYLHRWNLNQHMLKHSVVKPYTCSICGKAYTQRSTLISHQVVHSDNQKPYSCDVCGKSFREKSHLGEHTVVHTGFKPYSCLICNKKFTTRRRAAKHVLLHSK
ncbi:zinc finger protein 81 isoform X2 [Anabrus simplex]|uniref:zinc finger protein 81 isoform X2 n=1 Tax=Anabrus simplex TaxID=316456 RepID=UPI0035A2D1EA